MKKAVCVDVKEFLSGYNPRPRERVGCCRYDKKSNSIIISGPYEYEVDLDRCKTAGQCLDWIHQIRYKTWGPSVIVDFTDILYDYIAEKLWSGA